MPGATPGRGYPYPIDTDPIDVAGDIQRLAEAVDADHGVALAALEARIAALEAALP
jgi:hypothetical protein